jgi:hypothetical protein
VGEDGVLEGLEEVAATELTEEAEDVTAAHVDSWMGDRGGGGEDKEGRAGSRSRDRRNRMGGIW